MSKKNRNPKPKQKLPAPAQLAPAQLAPAQLAPAQLAPAVPISRVVAFLKRWGPAMGMFASAVISAVSAISACTSARTASLDSSYGAATLQVEEPVRLSLSVGPTGVLRIRNHSNMNVGLVEVESLTFVYSHACNAVLYGAGDPEILEPSINQRSEITIQLKAPFWSPDGGQAELKREQTLAMMGCGTGVAESQKNDVGLFGFNPDVMTNKPNITPACSEERPCSLITYIEARAMHPKLHKWAGLFDAVVIHSPDQSFHTSWSFGSFERDTGRFSFNTETDKEMFTVVAKHLKRYREGLGWNEDRARRAFPSRAFGGAGLFRAVGVDEPKREPKR